MRFVEFLLEAPADENQRLSVTPLRTDEDLVQYLIQHASDARWMFEQDEPFWRGTGGSVRRALEANTGVIVDPTQSERKSQTISNYYTLILDNHPERTNWPKRSRSLIAGANRQVALPYGIPFVTIPLNGTKIGYVNNRDIWDTVVNLSEESTADLPAMNNVWGYFFEGSGNWNWDTLKQHASAARLDDPEVKEKLAQFIEDSAVGYFDWDDMLNHHGVPANGTVLSLITALYANDSLSPRQTMGTTSDGGPNHPSTEVWIGGPTVMIASWASWNDIRGRVLEGWK